MNKSIQVLTVVSILSLVGSAHAVRPILGTDRGFGDSSSWMSPMGLQRGVTNQVTFTGARLGDIEEVLFYQPGFKVHEIKSDKDNRFTAAIEVLPECALGEHSFRVRTRTGISRLRTFRVGTLPSVDEKEPNNELEQAQSIILNATLEGRVTSEDIDYFKFTGQKGQRISVEVEAVRLVHSFFDAYTAVMDAKTGQILAESDDTGLFEQDPALSLILPKDGEYLVQVRESSYGGGNTDYYRVHIGTFARPVSIIPSGGPAGQEVEFTLRDALGGEWKKKVRLPNHPQPAFGIEVEDGGVVCPSPNLVRVSSFPNTVEVEPNEEMKTATLAGAALPMAFNGVIDKPGDIDWFGFEAKKDQTFEIGVFAREMQSALDSVINIYDEKGRRVTGNDDASGKLDSYVRYKFPADGKYFVRIEDHQQRGGQDFVYRVEFMPYGESVEFSIPHIARRDSRTRQAIVIPRGSFFTSLVSVRRQNVRGDIDLTFEGLPEGVTLLPNTVPANQSTHTMVFGAAADAPLGARLLDMKATLIEKDNRRLVADSRLRQVSDLVHSNPNQTVYYQNEVNQLVVGVIEESPFTLRIEKPKTPFPQYGTKNIRIHADKKEGWDETIYVYLPYRSPGVSANYRIAIPKGKTYADYTLTSRYNSEVGTWKYSVNGHASYKGADLWLGTPYVDIEMVERHVLGKFETTTVERNSEVEFVCTLDQKVKFDGKAKLRLLSLPHSTTADEVEITSADTKAVFKIKASEKSPIGLHKNVYCRMALEQNGEVIDFVVATGGRLVVKPAPEPAKTVEGTPAAKKVASAK